MSLVMFWLKDIDSSAEEPALHGKGPFAIVIQDLTVCWRTSFPLSRRCPLRHNEVYVVCLASAPMHCSTFLVEQYAAEPTFACDTCARARSAAASHVANTKVASSQVGPFCVSLRTHRRCCPITGKQQLAVAACCAADMLDREADHELFEELATRSWRQLTTCMNGCVRRVDVHLQNCALSHTGCVTQLAICMMVISLTFTTARTVAQMFIPFLANCTRA